VKPADIRALLERRASAMARRPDLARHDGHSRVSMGGGFVCEVEHEDRRGVVDQPAAFGGGAGPDPEQLMRASLAASLAMGYRLWGARLGVAIDAVTVEVACHSDARGQLGVSDQVAVGWLHVRFDVTITSAAPADDVRRVVATADARSPMLANLSAAVRRTHGLTLVPPEARRDR
jgi:uncharacterized OsmC-like protein